MPRTVDDLQDDLTTLDAAYLAAATDARAASRAGSDAGALWRTCRHLYAMARRVRIKLLADSWDAELR